MRVHAVLAAALVTLAVGTVYAETNFEEVRFIQYLDENTALEEVRKGTIDMYYWRIPSDRLADSASREGLQVYESTGNNYSILANPAETETFNPFSLRDVRFALNYLVDRNFIVNELMSGYGVPMMAYYGPYDPEYISIIDQLESYKFLHNPTLAREMITSAMEGAGGVMEDGVWVVDGQPVEITFFIRSDDPFRKSIGEVLSAELEEAGFVVHKDLGDLNKAFVTVYGSNPADLQWHLYTEGWGRSGFVRYDSSGLAQMYAPWFSNMPGFGDPTFWNYEHPELDAITQSIYTGDFASAEERTGLIRQAIAAGVDEGVRIFLAGRADQYVVHEDVDGVINDFGAGVPSRFTTLNTRSTQDTLDIGVKQVYQGAWNPVAGLTDVYSNQIWYAVYDPPLFRHPYSGSVIPVGSEWETRTAGPDDTLDVPPNTILWDEGTSSWVEVGEGVTATSAVTFHYTFGNWHHGIPASMDDVLYSAYFVTAWGTNDGPDDATFDPQYTPRAAQGLDTIKGIRVTDQDTIEVYVDYWHFDEDEIAAWASLGTSMPWEMYHAMERAVLDGKTAFSRSVAGSKDISWLSVLIPNDAATLREYLAEFREAGDVPAALQQMGAPHDQRYDAAISWIDQHGHAAISNGPYMVQGYSPESRTITIQEFEDDEYPFAVDRWSEFESVSVPKITGVDLPTIVREGQRFAISVDTEDATSIKYFINDATGGVVASGDLDVELGGNGIIYVNTEGLAAGAAGFRVFALSDTVLRPDSYSGSFFVIG